MEDVKIHPALSWDCPKCNKENFQRMQVAGLLDGFSADVVEEIKERMGIPPDEAGDFLRHPKTLTCSDPSCLFMFEDFNYDDNGESDD